MKNHTPHYGGLLAGHGGGRTDNLHISVPRGSYILPADVVSSLGENNTAAGGRVIEAMFGKGKGFSKGGMVPGGMVPIIAASGEYHLMPDQVKKAGDGDEKNGHEALDEFVKHAREKNIKELENLPGPKK